MRRQVYTRFTAWWEGRKDGKRGFPKVEDEDFSFYVQDLQNAVEGSLDDLRREWMEEDTRLKTEWCSQRERFQRAEASLASAQGRGSQSAEHLEESRALFDESYGQDRVGPAAYWTLLALIGLAEIPLNTLVFDLFGEARLLTLVMASSLAIMIPLFAHFLGKSLKKRPFQHGFFHTEAILAVVMMLLPLLIFGFIGYLRQKFFEATGAAGLLGVEIDPTATLGTFFILNMFLFIGATILSYYHYQPGHRSSRYHLKQALKRHTEESEHLAKLQAVIEASGTRLHELREERESALKTRRFEAASRVDNFERHVAKYRKHNLRQREDATRPNAFKSFPIIDVPRELRPDGPELSWDCGDRSRSGVDAVRAVEEEVTL